MDASRHEFSQVQLVCADAAEATAIGQALLEAHLIACAKQAPVQSTFWWEGRIDQANETLLIMDTATSLLEAIEARVAELHSYETFVLQALPISHISDNAAKWLTEALTVPEDH